MFSGASATAVSVCNPSVRPARSNCRNTGPKLCEALHYCLAYQDYARPSDVLVTEFPDRLIFECAGALGQGTVEDFVLGGKARRFAPNPLSPGYGQPQYD